MTAGFGHSADGAVLPWGPTAPSTARHLTDQLLAGHSVSPLTCRETMLVVSELVTNAVQHGSPPLGLSVTVSADRIAVEVTDGSSATPVAGRAPAADQAGGGGSTSSASSPPSGDGVVTRRARLYGAGYR